MGLVVQLALVLAGTWLLIVAYYAFDVAYRAFDRWRRRPRGVPLGVEVEIVYTAMAFFARRGDRGCGPASFLLAAWSSPGVADVFARAGVAAERARAELARLAALESNDASALQPTLIEAAQDAQARGDGEVGLADVLDALDDPDTELGRYLRALGVSFDDPELVTIRGEHDGAFVYLRNDDTSPMEKVVSLLQRSFDKEEEEAIYLMLCVHHRGFAALGPYDDARATELAERANLVAQELGIHLQIARRAPDTSGWRNTATGLLP